MDNNTVVAKSAIWSKVNWTQGVAFLAMLLSIFGFDLDEQTQTAILSGIISVAAVVTWFFRTFRNNTVAPEFANKTVFVQDKT